MMGKILELTSEQLWFTLIDARKTELVFAFPFLQEGPHLPFQAASNFRGHGTRFDRLTSYYLLCRLLS